MAYRILADIVVVIHLLWIMFLIAGAFWGVKHKPIMMIHGTGLVFAVLLQAFGWYCPLTHLEVWLWEKAGSPLAYEGSFIGHYAVKLIYIDVPAHALLILSLLFVLMNGYLYLSPRRKR